jgi:uncharacterized lipoprotein YddW (UPF0748 family)
MLLCVDSMLRAAVRRALAVLAAVCVLSALSTTSTMSTLSTMSTMSTLATLVTTSRLSTLPILSASPLDEVRALWVVRTTLTSAAAIATMVKAAKAAGFNTLLVQVRGRGDAYYQGALEPRPAALTAQPEFDPLAATITRAHEAGLQVHAWINVNLVAGLDLPSAREHVIYRHPEWLMVPRQLADDLGGLDPRSPEYVGRLSRYARSRPAELEGLYLSPVSPGAADYTVKVVRDIAERYAIDGVHLDYVRYPDEEFDYSRDTLAAFHRSLAPNLTQADERRYTERAVTEPLVYTLAFPERWRAFRTDRLTALVADIYRTVKAVKPAAILSAAVSPDPADAAAHRLQDWPAWLDRNILDVLCPMVYTTDPSVFAAQVATARRLTGDHPLWAGIGAYRLTSDQITENVQAARRLGVRGMILFSYDSLTDPSRGPDYLAQIGRAAFSTQ